VLSFINVGIYWVNHHHLLHTAKRVSGSILWANMFLLFWLSLVPFTTGWMGENHFALWPVFVYMLDMLMSAVSYYMLQLRIVAVHGNQGALARAIGADFKGKASLVAYVLAAGFCFAMDRAGAHRRGCIDVAYPRSAHRKSVGRRAMITAVQTPGLRAKPGCVR